MFGLVYTTQTLSTCLRCRFRPTSRSAGHRAILTLRHLTSGQVERPEPSEKYNERLHVHPTATVPLLERWIESDRIVFRPKGTGQNWRRFRLGQQTVALDMNVLGEPAQIRILPDRPKRLSQPIHVEHSDADDSGHASPEDFIRGMAAEAKAIDPAEVNFNIEELHKSLLGKENITQLPTLPQCRKIAQELHDGFTKVQLEAYLRSHSENIGTKDYDCLEETFHSKDITRSAWFSGVSNFPQEAVVRVNAGKRQHSFLLGLSPPEGKDRQTEKQYLVEKVLRHAWSIRCQEEKVLEGELDLRLQGEHLRLLLNHKSAMFKKLSEQYGAKIDISKSQHIVRLTGDYATCSDLSKLVYFMIEKIKSAEIEFPTALQNPLRYKTPPSAIARSILNDKSYLRHIENLTNTLIKPTLSTQGNYITKLQVYYIGPDTTDFEDVQRLVLQLLEPSNNVKSQVQLDHPPEKPMVPTQTPIEVGSAVPWTERGTSWVRWSDGYQGSRPKIRHEQDQHAKKDMRPIALYYPKRSRETAKAAGRFLSEGRAQLGMTEQKQAKTTHWLPFQEHMISAVLGHIAYPALSNRAPLIRIQSETQKTQSRQVAGLRKALLKAIDSRRILVTSLPEVLTTLQNLDFHTKDVRNEICIRLTPSQIEPSSQIDVKLFPEIEIRIWIHNTTQSVDLESIRFIHDKRESDVLLPQQMADIRFHAHTFVEAEKQADPAILQFIKDSNLDVWGVERLRTPSKLKLLVPHFVIPKNADDSVKEASGIQVEYSFASMEYQSYIGTLYQGFHMVYATIEAGKTGGRRSELRFETSIIPEDSADEGFIPFFDAVREFVAVMGRNVVRSREKLQL